MSKQSVVSNKFILRNIINRSYEMYSFKFNNNYDHNHVRSKPGL